MVGQETRFRKGGLKTASRLIRAPHGGASPLRAPSRVIAWTADRGAAGEKGFVPLRRPANHALSRLKSPISRPAPAVGRCDAAWGGVTVHPPAASIDVWTSATRAQ